MWQTKNRAKNHFKFLKSVDIAKLVVINSLFSWFRFLVITLALAFYSTLTFNLWKIPAYLAISFIRNLLVIINTHCGRFSKNCLLILHLSNHLPVYKNSPLRLLQLILQLFYRFVLKYIVLTFLLQVGVFDPNIVFEVSQVQVIIKAVNLGWVVDEGFKLLILWKLRLFKNCRLVGVLQTNLIEECLVDFFHFDIFCLQFCELVFKKALLFK